ncbi:MAG: hypothetical protein JWL84_1079 [Rhodospirillales bacterium]|nr:hypothetical protein [Rhodospirillales bacterium]
MTITGAVFLPVELLIILLPWTWVLVLAPVTTIFIAAAVLIVGGFSLQPGFFMAALIIGRTGIEICLGRVALPREMLPAVTALAAFVLACVVSLWIAVMFFQGHVLVLGGTDGFVLSAATPYEFRRENVSQGFYLFANVALTLSLALQACRRSPDELAKIIDRALLLMMVVATLLCLWQWLNFNIGLWWPKEFFASDPTHPDAGGQEMLEGLRVNGPFTEPSSCASYFAGFLFYAWHRFLALRSPAWLAMTLGCVVVILLSKSTTGIAMIGLFGILVAGRLIVPLLTGKLRRPRLTWRGIAVIGLLIAAVAAGLVYAAANADFISKMLATLVFEKAQGSSYVERSGSNSMAVNILIETFGLGIGIGSHVASTILLTLLSNSGIPGTLALAAFVLLLFAPVPGGHGFQPVHWFLVGIIAAASFVGTNLNPVVIWLAFGLALGARTSVCIAVRHTPSRATRYSTSSSLAAT